MSDETLDFTDPWALLARFKPYDTVDVYHVYRPFVKKLKELERPIGLKGHELMGAETAQDVRDFISAGRKNMIIPKPKRR